MINTDYIMLNFTQGTIRTWLPKIFDNNGNGTYFIITHHCNYIFGGIILHPIYIHYSLIRYRFHSGPKSIFRFFENAHISPHFRVHERRVESDVDFTLSNCLNGCRTTSVHTCWVSETCQLVLLFKTLFV